MNNITKVKKSLEKKAKKGFKGYPLATIAFYGPTHALASKVVVGITAREGTKPDLHKWYSNTDIRINAEIMAEVLDLLKDNEVCSVVMVDKIIGCPHEEGIDYPENEACPECPYWAGRDRWTGNLSH